MSEDENDEQPTDLEILLDRKKKETKKRELIPYVNKQRTLVFCSRGVNRTWRHLTEDFRGLLPHSRKENKHDLKKRLYEINELCEIKGCNNCLFFEARKQDLYLWVAKTPSGPSAKFLVDNIHTMDELRLTGNCLKGSRPVLSFDKAFDDKSKPHLALLKELFAQTFGTPKGHPKSKPFIDHVFSFSISDGKIWFRNFQIVDNTFKQSDINRLEKQVQQSGDISQGPVQLVEIGPRFVLTLQKIFDKSFHGATLFTNEDFIRPRKRRRQEIVQAKADAFRTKLREKEESAERKKKNVLPKDPLKEVFT